MELSDIKKPMKDVPAISTSDFETDVNELGNLYYFPEEQISECLEEPLDQYIEGNEHDLFITCCDEPNNQVYNFIVVDKESKEISFLFFLFKKLRISKTALEEAAKTESDSEKLKGIVMDKLRNQLRQAISKMELLGEHKETVLRYVDKT